MSKKFKLYATIKENVGYQSNLNRKPYFSHY